MSQNPLNLALRFLLEMAALISLGYWGWTQWEGLTRWMLAIGGPLVAAIVWGTFRVPEDASSSGEAPVPVPGVLRLSLELAFFTTASLALWASGRGVVGILFAVTVLFHYLLSYDRVLWLIRL